jgi:soluble lytic murein transglycosylase-like protein
MKSPGVSKWRIRRNLPSRRDWLLMLIGVLVTLIGVEFATYLHNSQVPLKPEAATITSPWIPSTVMHWEAPIAEMSHKYNIDPNLLAIIMTMESGGYAKADSGVARGLMQITPPTAKDIASKYLKEPRSKYDLWDPRTNIEFGAAYLAQLRNEFGSADQGPDWDSTVELLAAGYNGGPGAANSVEQGTGLRDTQTVVYSRDAFNMWRERHAGKSPTFDRWKERGGSLLIDEAEKAHQ